MRMLTGTTRAPSDVVATVPPDLVEVDRREGGDRRGDGRLQARVPPVGADRGRGRVHRRVQHPRAARHHDAGRAGDRVQRAGHPRDRDELRRQRARAGQPRQLDDRAGAATRDPQRRRRATGRGRPGRPRQSRARSGSASPRTTSSRRTARSPSSTASSAGVDALTLFPGEGTRCVVDQLSREPDSLARSLAACLQTLHHPKLVLGFDAILVMGPEHARVFADAGWGREEVLAGICAHLNRPGSELVRGAGRDRRGPPRGVRRRAVAAEVPRRRPAARLRRRRRRAVLRDHRRLGQRGDRIDAGDTRGAILNRSTRMIDRVG